MSLTYDVLNRPVSQSYAGGDILFSYYQGSHAISHLSHINDGEGTDSFAYDQAGRVITETRGTGPATYVIGYSYDALTGEPSGMTYPSGMAVSYSRDTTGQISRISLNGAPLVTSISRLPFGPVKSAMLGSINLAKGYDQRYNVSRITAGSLDYVYTRNAGGFVTGISGPRMPTVTDNQSDYSYNPANNQLTGSTGPTPKTYAYDAAGNMVSDGTSTFTWDGLNRLVKVEKVGATVAEYGYDAANRRIRKTVGAVTTHYLYDQNNQLIAETSLDGTVLREYIYLDGEPIALREYQTNPGTYYFINDHLGTPQELVDGTGAVVWQAAYLPFGQTQIVTGTVTNNLRFPGQYFDAETGLHYNWNRFYDPELGRYISADPIGLKGGMNLYLYVSGNPVNWMDPWGLKTCVLVTRGSFGFADHAALYMDRGDNGHPALYDPSGSYAREVDPGSGDLLTEDYANIQRFSNYYQEHDGSNIDQTCKETSEKTEKEFFEKALEIGPGFGPSCASIVSEVIGGSSAFPNVKPGTFFPGKLFRNAR